MQKKSGGAIANRQVPRPFCNSRTASVYFPSAPTFDAPAAASVVGAVAVARASAVAAAFAARASAPIADFSPRWRSASCTADALCLAAAEVSAALGLASSPNFPAASGISDLSLYFRYSVPPDADTRANLSDAPGYLYAFPSAWFRAR